MENKTTSELVSIITPCYNAALYINDTIISVINQTYKNWELIIVDDCSTDNSVELIQSFKDQRIKLYKTNSPSGSPALPRNMGVSLSKGKYVAFLDSDDIWLPNKLESQLNFLKQYGAKFVYSYYQRFTSYDSRGGVIKSPDFADYNSIKWRDYIPMLTILLEKDLLEGVEFENCPKEDFVFLLKLFKKGVIAYNTRENVALYRISPYSRSSNKYDMLIKHYRILRYSGFSCLQSALYTITHCIAAFIKYNK